MKFTEKWVYDVQNKTSANVPGIDVSKYQGTIDWTKVASAGHKFVFVKATQGSRFSDAFLAANVKGASKAGLYVGVYCFSEANTAAEGASEAKFIISELKRLAVFDLVNMEFMLDLETKPSDGDFSSTTGDAIYRAWEKEIKAAGKKAGLYTGNSFGSTHFTKAIADAPIWVARYSTTPPSNFAGWTSWDFWQYSSTGAVPGIVGNVDMNVFKGTLADLKARYDAKKEDYKMKAEDANKIIKLLQAAYAIAPSAEIGRLADELRKASNQPIQNG
jgi:lysozyme